MTRKYLSIMIVGFLFLGCENNSSQKSENNETNQSQNNEVVQGVESNTSSENENIETTHTTENNETNQSQNGEVVQGTENNTSSETSQEENETTITDKMIFFSPTASYGSKKKHPKGTFDDPMLNTRWLCKEKPVLEGYTFYFRGGVYHNPNYNTPESSASPDIYCSGTKEHPIVIKPWKDEHVKIKFDSSLAIKLSGNYLELEGFEIEGTAQEISYEDAVAHWWKSTKYYNGGGILLNGVGLHVRDNVIHDTTGAGIGVRSGGTIDDLVIENNVIFNASWWNIAGTTAIGLVNFDKPEGVEQDGKAHIVVKDNLVFASESRIFSRVYSKGFSHLSLDEGSSMLIKNDNGSSYDLGFLIENNFFLYNGKGASIRWDDTTFKHNTFYNNGTTIEGKGAGFRSNGGKGIVIEQNAVVANLNVMESDKPMNAIDFSKTAEVISCKDNLFEGGMSLLEEQKCLSNNSITSNIFSNPDQLDFSTSTGAGASQETFEKLKQKVEALGFHVAPANYTLKIDGADVAVKSRTYYKHQQNQVKALVEEVEGFESISELGTYTTPKGKEIYGYEIIFSDASNITGNEKFYLEVYE